MDDNRKTFFERIVESVFEGSDPKIIKESDTVFSYAAKQELRNKLDDYYKKNGSNMGSYAKNFGINLDKGLERDRYNGKNI